MTLKETSVPGQVKTSEGCEVILGTGEQSEQAGGAVPAFGFVKPLQPVFAEKVAVKEIGLPSALIWTPVKVCEPVKPATETLAVPSPVRSRLPEVGGLVKVTVTSAVKRSSLASPAVPLSLQPERVAVEMAVMEQGGGLEHKAGAVPALALVKLQEGFAEKLAVREMGLPSALIWTPVKVCEPVKPATETLAVPSPVRFSKPEAGGLAKLTVTSAVKKSSVGSLRVPLFLQTEILEVEIAVTPQAGGSVEQAAGAVPALLTARVQEGFTEKLAVKEMGLPSALIWTLVKVWVVGELPKRTAARLAVPSPVRFRKPATGELAKMTVTSAVKKSSEGFDGVPRSLQPEIFETIIELMPQTGGGVEQEEGAVPAFGLLNWQAVFNEKVPDKSMGLPSALIVTPVKVCGEVNPAALTVALPSPDKIN